MANQDLTATIKAAIAEEIQRRPIVHLTINLPLDPNSTPEHLANTITRVLQDFQCFPPASPPEAEAEDKPQ